MVPVVSEDFQIFNTTSLKKRKTSVESVMDCQGKTKKLSNTSTQSTNQHRFALYALIPNYCKIQ